MKISEATEILKERIALIKSEFPEMADYREALEMAVNALEKRTVKVTGERLTARLWRVLKNWRWEDAS